MTCPGSPALREEASRDRPWRLGWDGHWTAATAGPISAGRLPHAMHRFQRACLIWICAGNPRVGHGLGLRHAAVAPTLGPRDTYRQHRRAAVPDGVQARGWLRNRAHNRGAVIANSNLHRRHLKSASGVAMGRSLFVKSILDLGCPGCCRGGWSKKSQARAFARRAAH